MDLTVDNFNNFIESNRIAIVDFWATWCGPCKIMKPILEEFESDSGIIVGKVDADQNAEIATKYDVVSIPTILIFENGVPVHRIIGAMPKHKLAKELEGWV